MTRDSLFESMSFIEDELLEKSERKTVNWRKIAFAAACICLITVSAVVVGAKFMGEGETPPIISIENQPPVPNTPISPDTPNIPVDPYVPDEPSIPEDPMLPSTPEQPSNFEYLIEVVYNDADSVFSASRPYIPAYFREELSESELESLAFPVKEEWINFSGFAGFDQDGALLDTLLVTATRTSGVEISVGISEVWATYDYIFSTEAQVSMIGDVEVVFHRWVKSESEILLEADTSIDGVNMSFLTEVSFENETEVKKDFETLIYLFVNWFNAEKLDGIKAEYIPEYRNEQITLTEAYNDPDFGLFMPKELPGGFNEESVVRYKNYQLNYLSGLWTKGYSQIKWQVSYLAEGDELRFTSVESVENYDLSLYPIPMADSVPDELRDIVNNPIFDIEELTLDVVYARSRNSKEAGDVSGYRIGFDVRLGDIVVRISTKGVSPEWVYASLKALVE